MIAKLWLRLPTSDNKYMLQKTEGAIKNGQSIDAGNIEYTRYRTQTNKANNTTQTTKKISSMDPTKKPD